MKKVTLFCILCFVFSVFLSICYKNFVADVNYEKAKSALDDTNLQLALDLTEKSLELNPQEPNYYRMRARIFINYLPKQSFSNQPVIKKLIIADLQRALALNPNNLVTLRNIIPLYYFVATKNVLVGASPENVDINFLPVVAGTYADLKNFSPNDVGVYALVAKYEKRLNLLTQYNESVAKVRQLRPDLLDWYDSFR